MQRTAQLKKVTQATANKLSLYLGYHHLRCRRPRGQLVEVEAGVEGNEAHMRPLPPWQFV